MVTRLTELCWKCLRADEDGELVVDVSGGSVAAQMREHTPDVLTAVARNVQRQLECHEDAGDMELVKRYQWLQRRLDDME